MKRGVRVGRYCVVLVEGSAADKSDESAMVLGCSDIIALVPDANQPPQGNVRGGAAVAADLPDIRNLTTSFVPPSSLFVAVRLSAVRPADAGGNKCAITVSVYATGRPVAHRRLNCTAPWTTVSELPAERSYQVCASVGADFPADDDHTMVCASVDGGGGTPSSQSAVGGPAAEWLAAALGAKTYAFLLSATFTAVVFLFALLAYRTACRACKKPAAGVQTHQCFLPVPPSSLPPPENGGQRPRYVKLQATTVL